MLEKIDQEVYIKVGREEHYTGKNCAVLTAGHNRKEVPRLVKSKVRVMDINVVRNNAKNNLSEGGNYTTKNKTLFIYET